MWKKSIFFKNYFHLAFFYIALLCISSISFYVFWIPNKKRIFSFCWRQSGQFGKTCTKNDYRKFISWYLSKPFCKKRLKRFPPRWLFLHRQRFYIQFHLLRFSLLPASLKKLRQSRPTNNSDNTVTLISICEHWYYYKKTYWFFKSITKAKSLSINNFDRLFNDLTID